VRAEQEMERIEKAQNVLGRLADGQPHPVLDLWQGGPVVEWQLRFLKRLQRESMVMQHPSGFVASGRMVPLLKAAAQSVPAVVELLWPERTKDVLRNLQNLPAAPMPTPPPARLAGPPPSIDYVELPKLAKYATPPAPTPPVLQVVPPAPVPVVEQPEPELGAVNVVVATLRKFGPLPKRELQDRIGGKRQNAANAIETALAEGACFFGDIPGHVRPRMYLTEQREEAIRANAIRVNEAQIQAELQDDDGHETDNDVVATATDSGEVDTVDDETFKATVLKYTVIYGQNFITVGEHFRVLHETIARLEEKIDAITLSLEKP
jgi:hypothetical protein